jgi:hypothetical protein
LSCISVPETVEVVPSSIPTLLLLSTPEHTLVTAVFALSGEPFPLNGFTWVTVNDCEVTVVLVVVGGLLSMFLVVSTGTRGV